MPIEHISMSMHTFGDGTEDQYARFFQFPILVEEEFFQNWKDNWQNVIPENICQHIKSCS